MFTITDVLIKLCCSAERRWTVSKGFGSVLRTSRQSAWPTVTPVDGRQQILSQFFFFFFSSFSSWPVVKTSPPLMWNPWNIPKRRVLGAQRLPIHKVSPVNDLTVYTGFLSKNYIDAYMITKLTSSNVLYFIVPEKQSWGYFCFVFLNEVRPNDDVCSADVLLASFRVCIDLDVQFLQSKPVQLFSCVLLPCRVCGVSFLCVVLAAWRKDIRIVPFLQFFYFIFFEILCTTTFHIKGSRSQVSDTRRGRFDPFLCNLV